MENKGGRPRGQKANGMFIRQRRKARGLTVDELSRKTGYGRRTILRAQNGRRLSPDALGCIARVLQVSVDDIVETPHERTLHKLEDFNLAALAPPMPWIERPGEAGRIIEHITSPSPRICCIVGSSGVGKTALARFVAHEVASKFHHGVVWVKASSDDQSMDVIEVQQRIAAALELRMAVSGRMRADAVAAAFRREFWKHPRLLILDDLRSLDVMQRFVSVDASRTASVDVKASVLATTHVHDIADGFGPNVVLLGGITTDDTRRILSHHVGDSKRLKSSAVTRLHEELEGSPRSIHIASEILREGSVSVDEYAERIRNYLLDGEPPVESSKLDDSLRASLTQSRDHVSSGAWFLLAALSLFEEVPFTVEWAATAGAVESRDTVIRYLGELSRIYLVARLEGDDQRDETHPLHSIYRLESHIPVYARHLLGQEYECVLERVAQHAAALARQANKTRSWYSVRERLPLWRHVLDRLLTFLFDRAELAAWDGLQPFPGEVLPSAHASYLVETIVELAPWLERDGVPTADLWLKGAMACIPAGQRGVEAGRLLLALGRWWLRANVDLHTPVFWLDAATSLLTGVEDSYASAAASEAGRALRGLDEEFHSCAATPLESSGRPQQQHQGHRGPFRRPLRYGLDERGGAAGSVLGRPELFCRYFESVCCWDH